MNCNKQEINFFKYKIINQIKNKTNFKNNRQKVIKWQIKIKDNLINLNKIRIFLMILSNKNKFNKSNYFSQKIILLKSSLNK